MSVQLRSETLWHTFGELFICALASAPPVAPWPSSSPVCFFLKKGQEADVIGDYWSLSTLHLLILHCVFILLQPFFSTLHWPWSGHTISQSVHTDTHKHTHELVHLTRPKQIRGPYLFKKKKKSTPDSKRMHMKVLAALSSNQSEILLFYILTRGFNGFRSPQQWW